MDGEKAAWRACLAFLELLVDELLLVTAVMVVYWERRSDDQELRHGHGRQSTCCDDVRSKSTD